MKVSFGTTVWIRIMSSSFVWLASGGYRVRTMAYTEVALSTLLMHMCSPALWHGEFRCSSWLFPLDIEPGSS